MLICPRVTACSYYFRSHKNENVFGHYLTLLLKAATVVCAQDIMTRELSFILFFTFLDFLTKYLQTGGKSDYTMKDVLNRHTVK